MWRPAVTESTRTLRNWAGVIPVTLWPSLASFCYCSENLREVECKDNGQICLQRAREVCAAQRMKNVLKARHTT